MKIRKWKGLDTILTIIAIIGLAVACTACSSTARDSVLPATREYAAQVAADNAQSAAEGNPFSGILSALGTLVASLAGAGVMIRRFDSQPFQTDDGSTVTEDELAKVALAAREAKTPKATPPTG